MANFTKLTDAEKEIISTFKFSPENAHEWRDNKTWNILQDNLNASKWCVKAIHAENLNFEAVESLHQKKMVYWFANEKNGDAYYHLTEKGLKAAKKAGIVNV